MRIFVTLSSRDEFGRHTVLAQTSAPAVSRHVIHELLTNRLLEADEQDIIIDPYFPKEAYMMIAHLTTQIRTAAVQAMSEEAEDPVDLESTPPETDVL